MLANENWRPLLVRYRFWLLAFVWTAGWVFLLPLISLLAGTEAAMYAAVIAGFLLYDQVLKGWRTRLGERPLPISLGLTLVSVVGLIVIWQILTAVWLLPTCRYLLIDNIVDHSGDEAYFSLCYETKPDSSTLFWLGITAVVTPPFLMGILYAFWGLVLMGRWLKRRRTM